MFWLAAVLVGWSAGWLLGSTQAQNRSLSGSIVRSSTFSPRRVFAVSLLAKQAQTKAPEHEIGQARAFSKALSTGSYLRDGVGGWEKLPEGDGFQVALELQPQPG